MKTLKAIEFSITPEQLGEIRPEVVDLFKLTTELKTGYLLTTNNAKINKNSYTTGIMHLSPANSVVDWVNLCSNASKDCIRACLASGGRMGMFTNVKRAQIIRTLFYIFHKELFFERLAMEIKFLDLFAKFEGAKLAIRLNGTSDIDVRDFIKKQDKNIQFYDYTKCPDYLEHSIDNYSQVFSFSGHNWNACKKALKNNVPVSVVFANKLPSEYKGFKVIDGDTDDQVFRYTGQSVILGLKYKKSYNKLNVLNGDSTGIADGGKFVVQV